MNWIGMLVGAASGAVAVLIFAGLLRIAGSDPAKPKTWHKWTYYLLFAGVWAVSKETIAPSVNRWYAAETLETTLVENPAFAALQKFEPQTFNLIVADARSAIKNGSTMIEAQGMVRAHFAPLMEKRMPIAEDEIVHRYMKITIEEARELLTVGDEACYTFFFPGSGPAFDLTKRLKAETIAADFAAAAQIIESAATRPQQPISLEGEVAAAAAPRFAKLQAEYGAELALLDSPQTALKEKRRVCEIMVALYDHVLALPPREGGRIVRAMLNQR